MQPYIAHAKAVFIGTAPALSAKRFGSRLRSVVFKV